MGDWSLEVVAKTPMMEEVEGDDMREDEVGAQSSMISACTKNLGRRERRNNLMMWRRGQARQETWFDLVLEQ